MKQNKKKHGWVITDGKVGTEKPCRALALEFGCPNPSLIHVRPKLPWTYLPACLWPISLNTVLFSSPWHKLPKPSFIIAATRCAVKPSLALKSLFPQTEVIFWQDPRCSYDKFDRIIAPIHDGLSGKNVTTRDIAPSLVTPEICKQAAQAYKLPIPLEGPYLAVLLGGPNKYYKFTEELAASLGKKLKNMAASNHSSLLITASRRTPVSFLNVFTDTLKSTPHYLWDGKSPNPYDAFLGLAQEVLVTQDSISMTSDALCSGKPVRVIQLPTKKTSKFDIFFNHLHGQGAFRYI